MQPTPPTIPPTTPRRLRLSAIARHPRTLRRRGLGGCECLAALLVISLVLASLVAASDSLRIDSAQAQTKATLRQLRTALNRYVKDHGSPPSPPTERAIATLLNNTATAPLLRDVSMSIDTQGRPTILDGYGHAIEYVTAQQGAAGADFVSAGADGKFGHTGDRRAGLDDVYGIDVEEAP